MSVEDDGYRYKVNKAPFLPDPSDEDRWFGFYHCKHYKKSWESGFSWADTPQDCKRCKRHIKPWKQIELDPDEAFEHDNRRPHLQALCGRCRLLGRSCVDER